MYKKIMFGLIVLGVSLLTYDIRAYSNLVTLLQDYTVKQAQIGSGTGTELFPDYQLQRASNVQN